MVGFSSGGENPHGVKAVTNGQRCAVALWFTLDPLFRELVCPGLFSKNIPSKIFFFKARVYSILNRRTFRS